MTRFLRLLLLLVLPSGALRAAQGPTPDDPAHQPDPRAPLTAHATPQAPLLDGRLDDAVWQDAAPITGFTQRFPDEGRPATQATEVRLIYTGDALYVGARMHDTAPDSVVSRLVRRDVETDADRFAIFIDGYHDRRTGFYFGVNAAGTLYDGTLFNDSWDDNSWDGIWQARVARDADGWTAEMRIPFSQLRFHAGDDLTWGVNFRRDIQRRQETDFLVFVPRNEGAFVSRFRDLVGLRGLHSGMRLEAVPYVTAGAAFTDPDPGNPFRDGSDYEADAGLDLKVGLTSSLVLNATLNPDFGQVEVDPAVVNLSDRETFFPEKRPFFIEGQDVFNYSYGGANNNNGFNWGNPDLFYTRRIGRPPQGGTPDADFYDRPEAVRILGAGKLTGRVAGANAGFMGAVTGRSYAHYATGSVRDRVEVEPVTYYGVARMQREFADSRHGLGFMGTLTQRQFNGSVLRDAINGGAYVAGLDGWTRFGKDELWALTFWTAMSHVTGSAEQIASLQTNSLHYLQRPDLDAARFDPLRTSLTGFAGRLYLNKQRGRWMANASLGIIDPYFDTNDLGFQWNSNYINTHAFVGYRWDDPDRFTRTKNVMGAYARSLDFDGNTVASFVWSRTNVQFKNYYSAGLGAVVAQGTMSPRRTRGGPLTYSPGGFNLFADASTDSRKAVQLSASTEVETGRQGNSWSTGLQVTWQPAPSLNVSVGPNLSRNLNTAQYVTAVDDAAATATYGGRYVFADLDQWTLASDLRVNWTFTPTLSLQLFAQPLIASGAYRSFKELRAPRSFQFDRYGAEKGAIAGEVYSDAAGAYVPAGEATPEQYTVSPGAGGTPFSFGNPDFRFASLRGNAVMRWEFRPGSTLYFVWTQLQDDFESEGSFAPRHTLGRLVEQRPDHYFRVKLTYWLGR